ncbi:pyroglutamyl peptidase type [Grosmannia clavigera kw1407]|uniref:Pyroglutamyl peptidase type n=1 Tax=Grosmannia clavigera (strain kw1407 / UAMH 11150) TaxID=655863 RepID=F0XDC2_GROCL|nr:pyroglutamyl peptidase type [Grosmannia clavigera kw1407]EFX03845.1 pyroglutamyl peptidase type [Grosmannia clavigera kw1407]
MGSIEEERDEYTVLVTGFAPFRDEYPANPSWEIASRLPAYLPAAALPSSTADQEGFPPVRIVVYPEPIRVAFRTVRDLVPKLWDGRTVKLSGGGAFTPPRRIDLMLHIGMAGPRLHYSIERIGRRDGYRIADVDDCLPTVDSTNRQWAWYGVPPSLESHLDLDDVLPRWRAAVAAVSPESPPDLRVSIDAGRYLCDFTYFSSLAHLYRRGRGDPVITNDQVTLPDPDSRLRVAFLHVPASAAPERIATGRAVVVELLRALVASDLAARAMTQPVVVTAKRGKQRIVQADDDAPAAGVPTDKWYCD